MKDLPVDIIYDICMYLPPSIKLMLKQCVKYCYNNTDVEDILKNEIQNHGLNPNIFLKILDKYDAVISGSLLLKLLNGDEWGSNDIDIF